MAGPKEDRYRLLRATGANTSPVIVLFEDETDAAACLEEAAAGAPAADLVDDDGVRHRLWVVPAAPRADDGETAADGPAERVIAAAARGPVVIADGHHRYETALRYRDERRMTRSCEEDPPFDYALTLFLPANDALTVLPTHRVLRGLGNDGVTALLAGLGEAFTVTPADADALVARFSAADAAGGAGRFGLLTRDGAFLLEARHGALDDRLPPGGEAVRELDVTLLGAALEAWAAIDAEVVAAGDRVRYTKSATEALAAVRDAADGIDVAVLLEPTPVASILAVARQDDVMPQKSTYFYPKALTGLVINPHEW